MIKDQNFRVFKSLLWRVSVKLNSIRLPELRSQKVCLQSGHGMGVKASKLRRILGVRGNSTKSLKGGPHATVPRGYVPISVGVNDETKRFMVHTTAFYDADFLELLYRSAEEYGFRNQGVLRIPYEAKAFEERMLKGLTSNARMLRVKPS